MSPERPARLREPVQQEHQLTRFQARGEGVEGEIANGDLEPLQPAPRSRKPDATKDDPGLILTPPLTLQRIDDEGLALVETAMPFGCASVACVNGPSRNPFSPVPA